MGNGGLKDRPITRVLLPDLHVVNTELTTPSVPDQFHTSGTASVASCVTCPVSLACH